MRFPFKTVIFLVLFSLMGTGYVALGKNRKSVSQVSSEGSFYFVQITDTHFGAHDHFKRTRGIVAEINQLPMKIEFVVHTGDIVADLIDNKQVVAETLAVLNKLRVPVYYTPGNHDILAYDIFNTVDAYKRHFGKLIQQIRVRGVIFIFIYTEPLARSVAIPGYDPFNQLQILLRQSKNSPVIICHHRPSVEDFYQNTMHRGWPEKERQKWIKILNEYNVKAVIAGHFHKDQHHWLGDVPLYVASSVAGYYERQSSYRIYEYSKGKISFRTQYR